MELSIGAQTISVTAAALCGLVAGLLYDLLRQLRAVSGAFLAGCCDVFFCLYCTLSLFCVGMLFCGGRLTLWEPAAFLGVFALYLFGVSPSVSPVFGTVREKSAKIIEKRRKNAK